MKVWFDAQLPPSIARWMCAEFSVEAQALRDLGLREASDQRIFLAARGHPLRPLQRGEAFAYWAHWEPKQRSLPRLAHALRRGR